MSQNMNLLPFPFLPLILYATMIRADVPNPLMVDCPAKYTATPTYYNNLIELLNYFNTSSMQDGFTNIKSVGQHPDQVFGLAFCEGDLESTRCQSCVQSLVNMIVQICPQGMNMTMWSLLCLVRYSSKSFVTYIDNYSFAAIDMTVWLNPFMDPDRERFDLAFKWLMNNLSVKASDNTNRFAVGSVNYAGSKTLYGMQQCTGDLSSDTCNLCLQYLLGTIPASVGAATGASIYARSCLIRYGLFQFYIVSDQNSIVSLPPLKSTVPYTLPSPPQHRKRNRKQKGVILVISVASVLAFILTLAASIYLRRIKRGRKKSSEDEEEQSLQTVNITQFSFKILNEATKNFSDENILGHGGFAEVYKGTLKDGQEIAVKKFYRKSAKLLTKLVSGVAMIASLQHTNLVKLLGYCFENHEKLLVYEFLPNKSLNKVLFDPMARKLLVWEKRFMIIEGICRGLLYLHRDSGKNIIHRDLKPENILLDREMTPKIADFDLAKTFDIENTHENTEFVGGTFGYMAPELSRHRRFSTKSDIYSYGVMVLEILTGEQISEFEGSSRAMSLVDYVWQHWNAEAALEVLDPSMSNAYQKEEALKCIHVGLLCVQSDPAKRPSIQEVLVMLHNNRDSLPAPANPGYLSQHRVFAIRLTNDETSTSEETPLPVALSM